MRDGTFKMALNKNVLLLLSSKRNRQRSVILLLRKIGQFLKTAHNSHGAVVREIGTFC